MNIGNGKGNGDPRWVICERPCMVAGGELDTSMLELQLDSNSGVYAALHGGKSRGQCQFPEPSGLHDRKA